LIEGALIIKGIEHLLAYKKKLNQDKLKMAQTCAWLELISVIGASTSKRKSWMSSLNTLPSAAVTTWT